METWSFLGHSPTCSWIQKDPQSITHCMLHTANAIWSKQLYDFEMLKVSAFGRLDKLPVMRCCHFFLQLGQYILHGVLSLPICKKAKFLWFNLFHLQVYKSYNTYYLKFAKWTRFELKGYIYNVGVNLLYTDNQ